MKNLAALAALGAVALLVTGNLVPAVVLAARGIGAALLGVVLVVKLAATHPYSLPPVVGTAVIAWLAWPYLGEVRDGWLIAVGVVAAALAIPLFFLAYRDQHRVGVALRAGLDDPGDPAAPPAARHWSEDYR